jgi:predicted Zn finger-like uncharacterized protein
MKFYCHHCNKPYLIADERVRGKILKIRCKNCSTVITVREGLDQVAPPADKSGRRQSTAPAPAALIRPMTEPGARDLRPGEPGQRNDSLEPEDDALPPLDDEWYVSVDGVQEGPFSVERARDWVASRGPEDEVYCWRDSFDDWLPITDVPEFQGARRASKLALRPPPSTPSLSAASQARIVERAASSPDPDLFGGEDEAMTRVDPRIFGNDEPSPYKARPPAVEADDEPVMRLFVGEDAEAPQAAGPAPASGRLPSPRGPMGVPAIPGPAAGSAPAAQPPAARAWLSDPLSGPQPALRLPSPYPTIGDARQAVLAMTAGRGPESATMPARRRSRALLVVVLLLAVIGSAVAAYVLVRKYVRPNDGTDGTADVALSPLSPEDVSAELQRSDNQVALKRCYDQARQNSPELEIGRIDVDLSVDPAGQVARVSLSQHEQTPFGTCLLESIRAWTFRPSSKGVSARVPLIFGR